MRMSQSIATAMPNLAYQDRLVRYWLSRHIPHIEWFPHDPAGPVCDSPQLARGVGNNETESWSYGRGATYKLD